jgi:glutamine amidotransferase
VHESLNGQAVYFVHSFTAHPVDPALASLIANHASRFVAGISQAHVQALQFHPEKSGKVGLEILRKFAVPEGPTIGERRSLAGC